MPNIRYNIQYLHEKGKSETLKLRKKREKEKRKKENLVHQRFQNERQECLIFRSRETERSNLLPFKTQRRSSNPTSSWVSSLLLFIVFRLWWCCCFFNLICPIILRFKCTSKMLTSILTSFHKSHIQKSVRINGFSYEWNMDMLPACRMSREWGCHEEVAWLKCYPCMIPHPEYPTQQLLHQMPEQFNDS